MTTRTKLTISQICWILGFGSGPVLRKLGVSDSIIIPVSVAAFIPLGCHFYFYNKLRAEMAQTDGMRAVVQPREMGPRQAMVLWILWAAFVGAIFLYQVALGGGFPQGPNVGAGGSNLPVILGTVQVCVAIVIRWLVIPKIGDWKNLFVCMVVGLALSEAVEFYGIFLVPAGMAHTRLAFFLASLVSVLQFAPFNAVQKKPA